MERSETFASIVKAMVLVQSELKTVRKDRKNPFAENMYATLDAILEELLPKLNKHEIVLTQSPIFEIAENGNMRIGVETHLMHSSGEWFRYPPFFMQLEKGAKMNMAQSAGSVITYAKRYAVSAIFGISTGDDVDGVQPQQPEENGQQQNNQRQNKQQAQQQQTQQQQAPEQAQNQQQMPSTNEAIAKYISELQKVGIDTNQLFAEIAKKEGVSNIREVDKIRALGYLKTRYAQYKNDELKRQKQEQEAEQGNLLEGRTTQPVNWGTM